MMLMGIMITNRMGKAGSNIKATGITAIQPRSFHASIVLML